MNDLQQMNFRNCFVNMPAILDNQYLEKEIDLNINGLKLLKVTLIGISPYREPLTRKNIAKAAVVAQCECGRYCKFNFKGLVSPDSLPACGKCNQEIDHFIAQYEHTHHSKITRQAAWQYHGYQIDRQVHSQIFWYLLNKSNYHQLRLGPHFKPMTQEELDAIGIPKYMYLSRISKLAPLQSDPNDLNYAYQCLCGAFCYFKVSALQNFEPLGMCSVCTDELRYSFNDLTIHPFLKQLRFKHLWKKMLQTFNYPYVEFRYVWEAYFKARKLVRAEGYELHFSEYFHTYYQENIFTNAQV